MDKVRRIVHTKLRPFHFETKTYYLSDAKSPTDNPSQTENPSDYSVNTVISEFSTDTLCYEKRG